MADSKQNGGDTGNLSTEKALDLVSELFHRINRVIPQDQKLLTVPPNCPVRDAIAQMQQHRYSQVPVVDSRGLVLGVFSYRSFAIEAARMTVAECSHGKCAPGDLSVSDFPEPFEFAHVTDELVRVFDAMEKDNGILIGSESNLIGLLAPMDLLCYLYKVASEFVLVSEIELALRALVHLALTEEQISTSARRCLSEKYRNPESVPVKLEDMTFEDYRTLISFGDNWRYFEPVFGGSRALVSGKLLEIGTLRNGIFHFRRQMTMLDHETLARHRNWLLARIRLADERRRATEGQL